MNTIDHRKNRAAVRAVFDAVMPAEAERRILAGAALRIDRARMLRVRVRGAAYSAIAVASLVGLVPTMQYVSSQASASGFSEYASLFVSDTSYALANIKSMLLPLAESMPILGVALAVGILAVFGASLSRAIRAATALRHNGYSFA